MSLLDDATIANAPATGVAAHALLRELFPLLRSITGAGLRATVARLGQVVPLTVSEVPSGTQVFDWVVPDEWSITEAYLEDEDGKRWVDLRHSALHVVSYSVPVDATLSRTELQPHLHSLPEQPDVIPYRTSYYHPSWGFCLADRVRKAMPDGRYRAVVRSALAPGSLTLAEHHHRGTSENEILVFAHDCHPALANDNLSGLVVATLLAAHLQGRKTRYSYRFVFAPATIGSITWLSQNYSQLHRVRHGLVLSLLGGGGPFHYKQSRDGNHAIDRTAWRVVQAHHPAAKLLPFLPWGYDERQFCSVGLNLPVGRLTRTPNGEFLEYHTSADNPDFVKAAELAEAWLLCLRIFDALEGERSYVTLAPYGEPQLGRRGLYRKSGGEQQIPEQQLAILWVLNQSDGRHSLADIATRAGLPLALIESAADDLEAAGLLARA
jgi:aminopeptidase-like protein